MRTRGPRGKKQGLFVKVFRFCLPVPISSNYPHFTLCFLNKDYLHPSGMELQPGSTGSYRSPIIISPRQLNTSVAAAVLTAHPTARRGLTSSGALCTAQAHARTLCCRFFAFLSTIFSFLDQCLTHPPAWASTWLRPRPGKSPERLLSVNWELFPNWGFCLQPQGRAEAVPLSLPAIPAAGSDTRSLLPSSASDLFCR